MADETTDETQNPTESPVDLSELETLEKQILTTDNLIEAKQDALWDLGRELNTLIDTYKKRRKSLQKAVWTAQGLRVCPKCDNLKQANSFRYLYLEWVQDIGCHSSDYQTQRKIIFLCTDCYEEILMPVRPSSYCQRSLVEQREGKFFIFWEGKIRAFEEVEEVFDEASRAKILIEEEPNYLKESLFTVGRTWYTELFGSFTRIQKSRT